MIPNSTYDILTVDGFKHFDGFTVSTKRTLKLEFDGTSLICTPDHLLFSTDRKDWVEAQHLRIQEHVRSSTGEEVLRSISLAEEQDVVDLVNVETTHSFLANGIDVHNCVFLDEFAHVQPNIAEEFFTSIFPTISSGKETKILIASTPNGINHFYKFWVEAENKLNDFVPIYHAWNKIPSRDQAWADEQLKALGEQKFRQEVLTEFLGSSSTLIAGSKLATMAMKPPIVSEEGWQVYEHPQENHAYVICCDPARGLDRDASAFWVVDITQIPYRGVAKYQSHTISPIVLPNILYNAGMRYNHAFILVEINDNGQQVVDMLHHDLEYANIFKLETSTKQGAKITGGFKKQMRLGLRMTESVKRMGCQNLKTLIEQDKLLITDFDTISEFSTFTQQLNTFKADQGHHDDLVMCLVMFSWLMTQKYIRESQGVETDIRKVLEREQNALTEDDILPYGTLDTGLEDMLTLEDGDLWASTRGMDREELERAMVNYVKRSHGL